MKKKSWFKSAVFALKMWRVKVRAKRISLIRTQRLLGQLPSWWGDVKLGQFERIAAVSVLPDSFLDIAVLCELLGISPKALFRDYSRAQVEAAVKYVGVALSKRVPTPDAKRGAWHDERGVKHTPLFMQQQPTDKQVGDAYYCLSSLGPGVRISAYIGDLFEPRLTQQQAEKLPVTYALGVVTESAKKMEKILSLDKA